MKTPRVGFKRPLHWSLQSR